MLQDKDDHNSWHIGKTKEKAAATLAEIGHGQTPVPDDKMALSPVSFQRVTQTATVSFAQLRRVSLGRGTPPAADTAARALLVAMGLHAHRVAFERAFSLRSDADLRTRSATWTWLGREDDVCSVESTECLLEEAKSHALKVGVPLHGWDRWPTVLKPKPKLAEAIRSTWPAATEETD